MHCQMTIDFTVAAMVGTAATNSKPGIALMRGAT